MKKLLFILIGLFFLIGGCTTTGQFSSLEEKVSQIDIQLQYYIQKLPSKLKQDVMLLAEEAGARKFWWRNALIGGGDALDGIANASLSDGDVTIVATISGTTTTFYLYVYDSDGTNTDSGVTRIAPDDGGGAWQLAGLQTQTLTSNTADGERYINISNSGAFTGTPSNGDCFYRIDNEDW